MKWLKAYSPLGLVLNSVTDNEDNTHDYDMSLIDGRGIKVTGAVDIMIAQDADGLTIATADMMGADPSIPSGEAGGFVGLASSTVGDDTYVNYGKLFFDEGEAVLRVKTVNDAGALYPTVVMPNGETFVLDAVEDES